jgi:hypothetical protein
LDNKDELNKIAKEIRDVISDRQKELELSFVEDTHTYYMKDLNGIVKSNYPSVSTVIKQFYTEFPELNKSWQMCNGDLIEQDELLKKWRATADYANSKGSRVHYLLETDLLAMYGSYKEVRKPIFDCDEQQVSDGNAMIDAGHDFIRSMHRRGWVLLDTEMVLGSPELAYTGQPDKVWIKIVDGTLGFLITDWKTNKPKNFEVHAYTEPMLEPFEDYMDTALSHYMIQLPLYGRLILDMLKGTKFNDIKFFGSTIVHLTSGGNHKEYIVDDNFMERVLTMDPLPRIKEVMEYKNLQVNRNKKRIRLVEQELKKINE